MAAHDWSIQELRVISMEDNYVYPLYRTTARPSPSTGPFLLFYPPLPPLSTAPPSPSTSLPPLLPAPL